MTSRDRTGWVSFGLAIFVVGSAALQWEHPNPPTAGSGHNPVAYNHVTAAYNPVPAGRYPATPTSGALAIEPPRMDPVSGVLQPR